ncbi:ABC transporter substrate binding protein [Falsiroseomonas sp. HW251]|uniref:ABC transporter substrate binding protein n=1 Tax=Falsiroseomonas sp. HW251 TaxID=3390998 RepID=UPI003D3203BA
MRDERADAVIGMEEPLLLTHGQRIAGVAAAARLPTLFVRDLADSGPLLAFGTSLVAAARAAAGLIDRVIKGARPGDLPFEIVRWPELVGNLRVARAVDLTIPPEVLSRANQLVE